MQNLEPADEAAFVDSFFLPGGILDPEEETEIENEVSAAPFFVPPLQSNPWEEETPTLPTTTTITKPPPGFESVASATSPIRKSYASVVAEKNLQEATKANNVSSSSVTLPYVPPQQSNSSYTNRLQKRSSSDLSANSKKEVKANPLLEAKSALKKTERKERSKARSREGAAGIATRDSSLGFSFDEILNDSESDNDEQEEEISTHQEQVEMNGADAAHEPSDAKKPGDQDDAISFKDQRSVLDTCSNAIAGFLPTSLFEITIYMFTNMFGSLGSIFSFVGKMCMLVGLSFANTCAYAMDELEQQNGTFSCYLAFFAIPLTSDILMAFMSLPLYTPHVLSAICIYLLCTATTTTGSNRNSSYINTDDKLSQDVCKLLLRSLRYLLPFDILLEGFSAPNIAVMRMSVPNRLQVAYVLALIRTNSILSPVAWISWSFQVLLSTYLPESAVTSCLLTMVGLASVRLSSVLRGKSAPSTSSHHDSHKQD